MKSTIKNWIAVVLTLSMLSPALVSAQVQLQGPTNSPEAYSGVVYGPIDQNDTLWRIASRYKQDSQFSVYQTMLAIYELNPQAFENRNFNTMVNGATLQLPSDRYIARMDIQKARAKAEADDRAFGRPNSVQPEEVLNEVATAAAVPDVPLVNQEDLSQTKQELQRQLNSLNRQQNIQFDQVKEQVGASIASVQALIDENRRLYDRLDQVNQDISDLRSKVEGDVQDQIDQQLALQKEVIDLVKQAEQRQLDREAESIWKTLSSPIVVITISIIFTAGILLLLGVWLLRKPKSTEDRATEDESVADIIDDELIIGEMDDDDAEDLMAALDQEMGEDDILSSDLEDGLDELGVGDTDFGDIDDMLVPDAQNAEKKPVSKAQIVEEDVSFDTDAISLDDDEYENQEIDLKPSTEQPSANDENAEKMVDDLEGDASTINDSELGEQGFDEQGPDDQSPVEQSTDEQAQVENKVDPDELLASVQQASQASEEKNTQSNKLASMQSDTAIGMPVDESADIDDEALEKIENTINETTQEFEALSSEILNDLEGVVDEDEDLDKVIDESQIISLDADADEEPEIEVEPAKPVESEPDLSPELTPEPITDNDAEQDDEITAELPNSSDTELTSEDSREKDDAILDESTDETEDEIVASNELDDLLEQFTQDPSPPEPVNDDAIDLNVDDEPDDLSNDLANELLAELEEDVSDDDLDALLEEYTKGPDLGLDEQNNEETSKQIADSDALLDDIPSLSSMGDESPTKESLNPQESLSDDLEKPVQDDAQNIAAEDKQKISNDEIDEDEDVLADLPGLDDWLGDDDLKDDIQSITTEDGLDNELNVLADIEGSDFEELLSEIDAENLDLSDDLKAFENASENNLVDDELKNAGLDLDSLMQDDESADESVEDFVNVDDLLSESEALTPLADEDIALDLDKSLGRIPKEESIDDPGSAQISNDELISEQASNLDLAQVYMDMGDHEAATEVLEEVKQRGSDEQVAEATELLQQIKKDQ
ncbi:FimV/HubP family polar landmark protein [Glaciecola sp. SC05]|uniref:FimV/HubP family polar landmark protein n=1 Tax=Glaciecola sp. SC05 TaxID=1987355 RepID=UPI003526F8C4